MNARATARPTHTEREKNEQTLERIGDANSESVDAIYLQAMVDSHTATLAKLTSFEQLTTNAGLDALIAKNQPVVQDHLTQARQLLATP